MTHEEILKLYEGAHLVTIDGEKCMAIRLRNGFTLTTVQPGRKLRIQRYSEKPICSTRTPLTTSSHRQMIMRRLRNESSDR